MGVALEVGCPKTRDVDMPRRGLGWMSPHCDSASQESNDFIAHSGRWRSGDKKLPRRVSLEGHGSWDWDWHGSLSQPERTGVAPETPHWLSSHPVCGTG